VTADYLVIGGGVVGLRTAIELVRAQPSLKVVVVEKEAALGQHASGRNSGVLHAGFYYSADSNKARFCRLGNLAMREYIEERRLPLNPCGKLVVARTAAELPSLHMLEQRGRANGVPVELISEADAREIEPRVKTHEQALWSPSTATCSPTAVMASFERDARALGIEVRLGEAYVGRTATGVRTTAGEIRGGHVINCAGLYADKIARDFGFSQHYTILPFKGLYLYSSSSTDAFRTNIYPVPSPDNPFLGVHYTLTVDGKAKIGPTAIPCLSREQYGLLAGLKPSEMAELAGWTLKLLGRSPFGFRRLAVEEMRKYWRPNLVRLASQLASGVRQQDYVHFGKPGIRAQLLDTRTRGLVMDFIVERDRHSTHVLNAVSPAWTCSMPFAKYVAHTALGIGEPVAAAV
jgi:L-2-hydroxyglutarate oxidase